jgi:hypothetical protein
MTRTQQAVRKASETRLRADMAYAARAVADVAPRLSIKDDPTGHIVARAYIQGRADGTSSLTVRACLLTAWGC